MADEAISARSNQVLVSPGCPGYLTEVTVGDADEKPGHAVTGTGETHPEVDLRASTESLFGILLNRADLDIDTAISAANGALGVPMARYKSGARVYGWIQATGTTCVAGAPLSGGSEAGKFIAQVIDTTATINETTVEAALNMIAQGAPLICEDYTQDNTDDQVVEILL